MATFYDGAFSRIVNSFQPLTIFTKSFILDIQQGFQYASDYCLSSSQYYYRICRSSRLKVFCKKGVLRNFAKFTGKHVCQSLFFNKVAGLRPANLLKIRLWHTFFPVNLPKFLRTPFLREHLWWLFLNMSLVMCFQQFDFLWNSLNKKRVPLLEAIISRNVNYAHKT